MRDVASFAYGMLVIVVAFSVPLIILYLAVCTNYAHYR